METKSPAPEVDEDVPEPSTSKSKKKGGGGGGASNLFDLLDEGDLDGADEDDDGGGLMVSQLRLSRPFRYPGRTELMYTGDHQSLSSKEGQEEEEKIHLRRPGSRL